MDSSLIALLLLMALLAAAAFLVSRMSGKKSSLDKEYFSGHWQKIQTMEAMSAVISADKLLDEALKRLGVRGDTMGERMKNSRSRFSSNDDVWSAHKLRNRIVHEPDVRLKDSDAARALKQFNRALRDLGAL